MTWLSTQVYPLSVALKSDVKAISTDIIPARQESPGGKEHVLIDGAYLIFGIWVIWSYLFEQMGWFAVSFLSSKTFHSQSLGWEAGYQHIIWTPDGQGWG